MTCRSHLHLQPRKPPDANSHFIFISMSTPRLIIPSAEKRNIGTSGNEYLLASFQIPPLIKTGIDAWVVHRSRIVPSPSRISPQSDIRKNMEYNQFLDADRALSAALVHRKISVQFFLSDGGVLTAKAAVPRNVVIRTLTRQTPQKINMHKCRENNTKTASPD